jgi:hypothetical protein
MGLEVVVVVVVVVVDEGVGVGEMGEGSSEMDGRIRQRRWRVWHRRSRVPACR